MCPKFINKKKQQGVSLIIALFVIVVVALFVGVMGNVTKTSSQSYGQQVLSVRAFYAAESGAQIAITQLYPPSGASGITTCNAVQATPGTFTALNASNTLDGLKGCSAQISCYATTASGVNYYTITSTGACGTGNETATRKVEVMTQPAS